MGLLARRISSEQLRRARGSGFPAASSAFGPRGAVSQEWRRFENFTLNRASTHGFYAEHTARGDFPVRRCPRSSSSRSSNHVSPQRAMETCYSTLFYIITQMLKNFAMSEERYSSIGLAIPLR